MFPIAGIVAQKWMNKLESFFKIDCSTAEAITPFEIYQQGYNRAQTEYLKEQLEDIKEQLNNVRFKAGQNYVDYHMNLSSNYGRPQLWSAKEDV